MTKRSHFLWVKSQDEQRELERLGWVVAEQRATRDGWMMKWRGAGEPIAYERRVA